MNPEILARQMYLRSRISFPEFRMLSQNLVLQMYLRSRISFPEFKTLMSWLEGKKAKKKVRKRVKTDDKSAVTAQ